VAETINRARRAGATGPICCVPTPASTPTTSSTPAASRV
jgi:hypothetical protein